MGGFGLMAFASCAVLLIVYCKVGRVLSLDEIGLGWEFLGVTLISRGTLRFLLL